MERIELLAPAKDLETGIAAINCGADAVYIGAARFGAREAAANELGDLAALIDYAHRYWARVYVTLNTLLFDEELPLAAKLIDELYQAGADALIIQDTGLLELDLPPLPLFASTQMHNHSPEKIAFLEKVGFQRVILARELSLEQIKHIRAKTHLELETFVHGALCVSYSGQCAMSYALGGRSGNRGQCAQPCRRPYRLVDGAGAVLQDKRYLLSLRDLNLSADLGDLLDAGVRSFKIEGRLKDRSYVMNVVAYYRQQLDALLDGQPAYAGLRAASSGKVQLDFTPNPAKTFNRGFTRYFLHGRREPVGSIDTPKAQGEAAGQVAKLTRDAIRLDGGLEIHRGDGLCFFDARHELTGTTVNEVQGPWITPAKMEGLALGTAVYRNHDHLFLQQLEKSRSERKIAVRFRLAETAQAEPGSLGLALFAQDEDGNEAMLTTAVARIPAEKPEQALASIEKQLTRLGGTPFTCTFVRVDLREAYFINLGALNALRRSALEELTRQRLAHYPRQSGGAIRNDAPYPARALTYFGNVLNARAAAFYRRHGVEQIEPAAESGLEMRGRKVMTTRHCIKYQLGGCPKANQNHKLPGPLTLIDEPGNRFPLKFNCARCEMEIYYQSIDEG